MVKGMNKSTPQQEQALLHGPAMVPPGVKLNFVDMPNSLSYYILTISTCAILVRTYTKFRIIRKVGWDDYTAILGYFMWIAYCIPTSLIMVIGGGIHQWNVQLEDFISLLYYGYIAAIMYGITVFNIKLSILIQYMKIFVGIRKGNLMYWSIHIVIWVNLVFYITLTFIEIFLCHPLEKSWNVLITTGHCLDRNGTYIAAGVVNSFSDFVILLLPQGPIWKLQMPLRRKLAISAIFLTGLCVCITSILRLYYTIRLAQTGDVTYNLAFMGLWTYAELSMGVVCACLPATPRFFKEVRERLSTLRSSSSYPRTTFFGLKSKQHHDQSSEENSEV